MNEYGPNKYIDGVFHLSTIVGRVQNKILLLVANHHQHSSFQLHHNRIHPVRFGISTAPII